MSLLQRQNHLACCTPRVTRKRVPPTSLVLKVTVGVCPVGHQMSRVFSGAFASRHPCAFEGH